MSQWDSPSFFFSFCLRSIATQGLFEQSGGMLGFSHSWLSPGTWEGGKGKCEFSGCTSDHFIPHFVRMAKVFFCLCPTTLCFWGSAVLWWAHLYMWNQSQLCSDSVNDFTCLSFSICNKCWPTQGHKNNPTVSKFFNPLLCIPLGSLASSSSFRRILSFSSESWWTVEPLCSCLVAHGVWFSRGTQPTMSGWALSPDLLETLLWSES